ncbi:MAG: aldolase/citrate lyase family protein [Anaerolineae bacterium]
MALIEDQAGVEAIEEIVAVPGLDVVFPGPGDLSASMGLLGQPQHPSVQAAVNRVVEVVRSRPGLVLGYQVMDPAQVGRCQELGASIIILSQDTRVVYQAYRSALAEMRQRLER